MRKSIVIILTLLFGSLASSGAQNATSSSSRQFNLAILSLFDEYERTSTLVDETDKRTFARLFVQPDRASVYNDLIGTKGYQTMMSPLEYARLIQGDAFFLRTEIRDLTKEGGIFWEGGKMHRKVSFTKYVMIIDSSVYTEGDGGVFFDSSTIYEGAPDFRLIAEFVYDPVSGSCKIQSVTAAGSKPRTALDNDKFSIVLEPEGEFKDELISGGKPVKFNEYKQGFAYYDDIEIDNQNVKMAATDEAQGDHYNVKSLAFKPLRFRFKLRGAFNPGSAYTVKTSYDGIKASSSGYEFGADLGLETSPTSRTRFGLYAGAALSGSNIDLSVDDLQYSIAITGRWKRSYSFSATESLSLMDIVIPVYAELETDLGRSLMLTFDLGAKAYLAQKTDLGPYKVEGTFAGTQINNTYSQFVSPADYTRNSYDIAAFANIELDVCLVKKLLYAYASAGYEYAIKASYDSSDRLYFSENDAVYPFVYASSTKSDIPFRSLVGSTSYQRKALTASLGLKIKF